MTEKEYANYMLKTIINDLTQQAIFANTWPEVSDAIRCAKQKATEEHKRQTA